MIATWAVRIYLSVAASEVVVVAAAAEVGVGRCRIDHNCTAQQNAYVRTSRQSS